MPKTHRLFMLDIIRILCAVQVEMYHSITMFGCSYGRFFTSLIQYLIQPVMTCFFMMSGFSIYYMYHNTNIMEKNRLVLFYLKRAVSILPSYYLVHILYVFIYPNTLSDWIALTPIELLGIQSSYNTLFGILHNGGTWFISCMLLSYLFYPIMQMLLASLNQNLKWGILAVLLFILVYSDYLVLKFGMQGNYSNPIFRMIEFSCGVVLGAIWLPKEHRYVWGGGIILPVFIIWFLFLITEIKHNGLVSLFSPIITIPVICVIFILSLYIRNVRLENSKILNFLSYISYFFFNDRKKLSL